VNKTLLLILTLATTLRVAAALIMGGSVEPLPGTYDQVSYHELALRVLGGHGFTFDRPWWPLTAAGAPTAHWSYLYTLLLAGVYALAGPHALAARLLQALVVGILQPYLAFLLGRRLFGARAGLVAAALTAVYAYFVYYAGALMTEPLYFLAILATLYLAINLADALRQGAGVGRVAGIALALGVSMAATVLLRQLFLLFVPFLLLWMVLAGRKPATDAATSDWRRWLAALLLPVIVLVLAILPFTLRNYASFGQFVLLNTNAGYAFFWANHPIHGDTFIPILPEDGPTYLDLIPQELRGLDEAALDRALMQRGLAFVVEDPIRYIRLSLSRIPSYFMFWPSPNSGMLSNLARVLSFGLMLPFMVYGLVVALRRHMGWPVLLLAGFMLVYTGIHLLSWALVRYRLPVDAVWLVFAGLGVVTLWDRMQQRGNHAD
jgi:4-amino-4-deoxy-L-arabinose transferase-like glycosyltransferase